MPTNCRKTAGFIKMSFYLCQSNVRSGGNEGLKLDKLLFGETAFPVSVWLCSQLLGLLVGPHPVTNSGPGVAKNFSQLPG